MVTYKEASKIILDKYKDSKIVSVMQLDDGYLFSISPKKWNKYEILLDPFFKVTFDGKISEYSPVMDPKEFKKALNNIIYSEK